MKQYKSFAYSKKQVRTIVVVERERERESKWIKYLFTYVVIFTFFFIENSIYAQSKSIIMPISIDSLELDSICKSNAVLKKLKTHPHYQNIELFNILSLQDVIENFQVSVSLPNNECDKVQFIQKEVTYYDKENFEWYGTISEKFIEDTINYCSEGSFLLKTQNGVTFGNLNIENNFYDIFDIGNGKIALAEVNLKDENFVSCGNFEDINTNFGNDSTTIDLDQIPGLPTETGSCDVNRCESSILVLYTPAAFEIAPDVTQIAYMGIFQLNTALRNSSINNLIKFKLAGIAPVNFVENSTANQPADEDIRNIANNATFQSLRDQYNADIVVLLTNGNYNGIAGIAKEINASYPNAYAIVQASEAIGGRFTFAHEVAHLFGAKHENDGNGPHRAYKMEYRTWNRAKIERLTIMHRASNTDVRILYFSNPNVYYFGKATGASCNNNAEKIAAEGCRIGNFKKNNQGLDFSIKNVCFNVSKRNFTPYAQLICSSVDLPYSIYWGVSYDGIHYSRLGEISDYDTNFPTINISENYNGNVWIICKVYQGNYEAVHIVQTNTNNMCLPIDATAQKLQFQNSEFRIFPNPANNFIEIDIPHNDLISKDITSNIFIYNYEGKQVYSNSFLEKNSLVIPTINLANGIYQLRLVKDNITFNSSFIISH